MRTSRDARLRCGQSTDVADLRRRVRRLCIAELWSVGPQLVVELAKELGIDESCLRNWMAQDEADENGSTTRLTSAEKNELAESRKKTRQPEMETEILKRAAVYFAQENLLAR